VELINHVATGRTFQTYVNPGRPVSEATIRITGITDADLTDKPAFESPDIVEAFLDFIGDAQLVAHNARFDRGFLNMELQRCGRQPIEEARWIDTLALAKKRFPGAPASLDALCRRFDVSIEARKVHGALLDSQLLAEVYLELRGGRAHAFDFGSSRSEDQLAKKQACQRPQPLNLALDKDEMKMHQAFIKTLGDQPIWSLYEEP